MALSVRRLLRAAGAKPRQGGIVVHLLVAGGFSGGWWAGGLITHPLAADFACVLLHGDRRGCTCVLRCRDGAGKWRGGRGSTATPRRCRVDGHQMLYERLAWATGRHAVEETLLVFLKDVFRCDGSRLSAWVPVFWGAGVRAVVPGRNGRGCIVGVVARM